MVGVSDNDFLQLEQQIRDPDFASRWIHYRRAISQRKARGSLHF